MDEEKRELEIDFKIQGIPHAAVEQEDERVSVIRKTSAPIQKSPEQGCINSRCVEHLHVQPLQ